MFSFAPADLEKARSSGDLMVRMVEQQPELDQYFLLHVNGETGQLVRDGPEGLRLYYRLLRSEPKVGLVHTERVKGRQLVQTERVKGRHLVQTERVKGRQLVQTESQR